MVLKWARAAGSLVFVHDHFASGRRFGALNIIDDMTREVSGGDARHLDLGPPLVRDLIALIERRGNSGLMASDKGTEFTLSAVLSWAQETKVTWHFIAPGKPMQNGTMNCSTRRCFSPRSRQREDRGPVGLRRLPPRKMRSAAQPRPAPPITCCSHRA